MNIDFNHVRREAVDAFSDLVRKFQKAKDGDTITVKTWDINTALDDLRSALVGIACTYRPGDPEFALVLRENEVLPSLDDEEEHEV